jgi:G3E family GTPase
VLLNKIDPADRERVREVRDFMTERLHAERMIETVHADVPPSVLLGARPQDDESNSGQPEAVRDNPPRALRAQRPPSFSLKNPIAGVDASHDQNES